MSDKSAIEWTDATWNPVTGCTEVSPGCDHCYAKTFAERWRGIPGHHFEHGFDVQLRPEALDLPMRWRKPRRVFVNSMSDLFHKDVPDKFIREVFVTMGCAQRHTFQVLTKRPERMRRWARDFYGPGGPNELRDPADPMPNVWLGVSVESNAYAWRVDMLRETPAAVRFLSVEPMLGPIDKVDLTGIDWVIVGGESGHEARPIHPWWVRDVRDRCVAASIPLFFKQWGEWKPMCEMADGEADELYEPPLKTRPDARRPCKVKTGVLQIDGEFDLAFPKGAMQVFRLGKHCAGRELEGRTWDEFPKTAALA